MNKNPRLDQNTAKLHNIIKVSLLYLDNIYAKMVVKIN